MAAVGLRPRQLALFSKETSCKFKAERHEAAKEKDRRRKEPATSLLSSSQTFVCPKCSGMCASRIALYSHQRACKNWPSTFLKSSSARNRPSSLPTQLWALSYSTGLINSVHRYSKSDCFKPNWSKLFSHKIKKNNYLSSWRKESMITFAKVCYMLSNKENRNIQTDTCEHYSLLILWNKCFNFKFYI